MPHVLSRAAPFFFWKIDRFLLQCLKIVLVPPFLYFKLADDIGELVG